MRTIQSKLFLSLMLGSMVFNSFSTNHYYANDREDESVAMCASCMSMTLSMVLLAVGYSFSPVFDARDAKQLRFNKAREIADRKLIKMFGPTFIMIPKDPFEIPQIPLACRNPVAFCKETGRLDFLQKRLGVACVPDCKECYIVDVAAFKDFCKGSSSSKSLKENTFYKHNHCSKQKNQSTQQTPLYKKPKNKGQRYFQPTGRRSKGR